MRPNGKGAGYNNVVTKRMQAWGVGAVVVTVTNCLPVAFTTMNLPETVQFSHASFSCFLWYMLEMMNCRLRRFFVAFWELLHLFVIFHRGDLCYWTLPRLAWCLVPLCLYRMHCKHTSYKKVLNGRCIAGFIAQQTYLIRLDEMPLEVITQLNMK